MAACFFNGCSFPFLSPSLKAEDKLSKRLKLFSSNSHQLAVKHPMRGFLMKSSNGYPLIAASLQDGLLLILSSFLVLVSFASCCFANFERANHNTRTMIL